MPLTWIPNSLLSCHCLNNVGHLATVGSLLPDIMNSWSETQYLHVWGGDSAQEYKAHHDELVWPAIPYFLIAHGRESRVSRKCKFHTSGISAPSEWFRHQSAHLVEAVRSKCGV